MFENKPTGPSSIPLRLLSIIANLIILPLAYIIVLPKDLLKFVKVIPIH